MARVLRARAAALGVAVVGLLGWASIPARAVPADRPVPGAPVLRAELRAARAHDQSPPLTLIRPVPPKPERVEHEVRLLPREPIRATQDPVRQSSLPAPRLSVAKSFDGIGAQFTGPAGDFVVDSAPPDTNGDVGLSHYVQVVNTDFAVFSKTGEVLYGPVPLNTLWSGFAIGQPENACEQDNDGDGIVLYDALADRWLVTQFAVTNPNPDYYQCVAISVTGDPTGAYYRYAFAYERFNDYGKFGVWPDGYYATFNMFTTTDSLGAQVCAYDRVRMLQGQPAAAQCVQLAPNFGGLLPADLDGRTPPPPGMPELITGFDANPELLLWRYHVDWSAPRNSALTGPLKLPVATYPAVGRIQQPGTNQDLNLLEDRMMFRLAYRNFGDHESLVLNYSVGTSDGTAGIRWYEVRDPNGVPQIAQQGTWAPGDGNYRWMGSVAMDQIGNLALGYSLSGASTFPAIAYTGRLASDPPGVMTQGEAVLVAGGGSQLAGLDRWGDYSAMSVDPEDDCTFWYTNEYIAENGLFNWHTRIGSFRFPNCPTQDFSVTAPGPLTVPPGGSVTATVATAVTRGAAQTLTLTVEELPPGVTGSISPSTLTAGGTATLTLSAAATLAVTTDAPYHVTGVSASGRHTAVGTLTVPGNDFSIALDPLRPSITEGKSVTVTVRTQALSGPAEAMALELGGLPDGVTGQISPASLVAGETATLTLSVADGTSATRPTPLVVTGTTASARHAASGTVTTLVRPSVELKSPGGDVTVKGSVTMRAAVHISPGTNLDHLEYLVDGAVIGQRPDNRDPYLWDSTVVRNGPHTLSVRAFDKAGNEAVAEPISVITKNQFEPPVVTVTSPTEDGALVHGKVTLSATAVASPLSDLSAIEIYVDNTLIGSSTTSPASLTWDSRTMPDGPHTLLISARDIDGDTGLASFRITVKNACGCGAAGDGSSLLGLVLGLAALALSARRAAPRRPSPEAARSAACSAPSGRPPRP